MGMTFAKNFLSKQTKKTYLAFFIPFIFYPLGAADKLLVRFQNISTELEN